MDTKSNVIELDDNIFNEHEFEYTAVIVGRDLSSYLIALILKQHNHQVAIVSQSNASIMTDLYEYLSLKYLYEAARRIRSIHLLSTKGFEIKFDDMIPDINWQQIKDECKKEFFEIKQNLEKQIFEKNIPIYEGTIVMIEDYIIRIISEDELTQIAVLRTKYVILGSEICRYTIKDYSNRTNQNTTLKTLIDIIHLDKIPKSLAVIGGGTLGLSIASCMKQLGCLHVTIIEQKLHCLMNVNDIDREIGAYIESIVVKQNIDIITNCLVKYVTETSIHFINDSIKSDYRFVAIGTRRKLNIIQNIPTTSILQLIERVSFGRKIQLGTTINDGKGRKKVMPITPIITIDYQRVKNMCSMEEGVSIAYRTICKYLNDPNPYFVMPSFIYTILPVLLIGQTHTPADNMFICRVTIPPTIKYAIDTPPRGFGKLWISRINKTLCGVQLISEHALIFGKAFAILIRNKIFLNDICNQIELSGSIGEAIQLMIKQSMYHIKKNYHMS